MPTGMTSEQLYGWQIALELKLRRVSGVAFQDFFADVMTRAHGDDFVPTRPRGSLGDKGCDGYLTSSGRVFACYGKQDDASPKVAEIISKMDDDYAKACKHLNGALREWCFVHNMLDGTPTDVTVVKLGKMKASNPHHAFSVMGRAGFEERVLALSEADILTLIGPAASAKDTRNMRLEVVADIIDGIMKAVDGAEPEDDTEPRAVPAEKLTFNAIPNHWRFTIRSHMANAKLVGDYLGRHPDVQRGPKIAAIFKARYRSLKEQALSPGTIMTKLYQGVVGVGTVDNERSVAANALLAFLFDSCDIFEDKQLDAPGEEAA
jgi:hypothetical protein